LALLPNDDWEVGSGFDGGDERISEDFEEDEQVF
jgi:hypothetical protein